jgi:hypothetical protein
MPTKSDVGSWSRKRCIRFLADNDHGFVPADAASLRDQVRETGQEMAGESLLSLETLRTFKLCLSWGGPSDYFEIHWSEQCREWTGGRYIFQDWFDGAKREISADVAEQIAELFCIWPDAA